MRLTAPNVTDMQLNGALIRRLRTDANLSTRDLAVQAGIDHGYLSRVERGQGSPTQRWVSAVAAALGVPADTLRLPDDSAGAA